MYRSPLEQHTLMPDIRTYVSMRSYVYVGAYKHVNGDRKVERKLSCSFLVRYMHAAGKRGPGEQKYDTDSPFRQLSIR